ncbi:hypothetical protein ABZ820_39830 [Streptomyces diacarni]|uniref:hypothetical protein n=1 Tax=Streptomyces diacarni TaxID=2800381 RepID=UPI0033D812F9
MDTTFRRHRRSLPADGQLIRATSSSSSTSSAPTYFGVLIEPGQQLPEEGDAARHANPLDEQG